MSILRKIRDLFAKRPPIEPDPSLGALPDMTGYGLGMDYLISAMGENKEVPRVGDVVVELESCSMGASVRRDMRWRVTGAGYKHGDTVAVPVADAAGNADLKHVFYMRPANGHARTWVLCG